jgi:hypothetical protein
VGACEKLNSFHILGVAGAAGLLGLVTGSWLAAAIAGVVIVGMAINAGGIRFKGRR